jgi:phosphate transport system substrate-binding protein
MSAARVALLALCLAGVATVATAPAARAAAPDDIKMSGASTTRALVADLGYFYRHQTHDAPVVDLSSGVSGTGIADAARGVVDAGLVSRALEPGDPKGLVLSTIATSGLCLITNPANRVPNLTRAQIQDIVAGRVTDWSQVPGATVTGPIAAAALDRTAGGRSVFVAAFVDPLTTFGWQAQTFQTGEQVRAYVAATPNALGYDDLVLASRLHSIPYEGVACSRSTIKSGAYPASRPLGIVTRGKPKGALARFLHWVWTSPTAKRVIATRYIPVKR